MEQKNLYNKIEIEEWVSDYHDFGMCDTFWIIKGKNCCTTGRFNDFDRLAVEKIKEVFRDYII